MARTTSRVTGWTAASVLAAMAVFGAAHSTLVPEPLAQVRFSRGVVAVPAVHARSAASQTAPAKAPAFSSLPGGAQRTTGLVDLGRLDKPGATLRHKRFKLVPGGTLRFVTAESAARGLGQIQVPTGSVLLRRTVLRAPKAKLAGATAEVEYRFTLPLSVKPGAYKVTAGGTVQARRDPVWAFAFELLVGKRRIGEPRPL